jgi:hypothetical protein
MSSQIPKPISSEIRVRIPNRVNSGGSEEFMSKRFVIENSVDSVKNSVKSSLETTANSLNTKTRECISDFKEHLDHSSTKFYDKIESTNNKILFIKQDIKHSIEETCKDLRETLESTSENIRLIRASLDQQIESTTKTIHDTIVHSKTFNNMKWYLTYDQCPAYLQVKYIKTGYRANLSYRESWNSLFTLHNESGNVWIHLLGCMICVGLIFYSWVAPIHPLIKLEDRVILIIYMLLATYTMLSSALYQFILF